MSTPPTLVTVLSALSSLQSDVRTLATDVRALGQQQKDLQACTDTMRANTEALNYCRHPADCRRRCRQDAGEPPVSGEK
jgi:hypothetical protein